MRLFIAEKPDLARALVEGLGGNGTRRDGYYDCDADVVTWAFGHMLQLMEPEDYDSCYKIWRLEDLPLLHIPWRKKPQPDKAKQLEVILDLLKRASSVVHAGDPDDEGQLLVDEILHYANCRLPVQRVLINDNNPKLVRRALDALRDNREFAGLSASAEARAVGDQLYGYNLSRAYTLVAQKQGFQGSLIVGRVQTPILGLVVRRDREHAGHTKVGYHTVSAEIAVAGLTFPARYRLKPTDPVDDKGRLNDPLHAKALAEAVLGQPATLLTAETKATEVAPPLPYNLLKLQTDASRLLGLRPDVVKDLTQSLREKHRLITYNRSDCQYLSVEQHADAPAVLAAIGATAPDLATAVAKAEPTRKSRAFDSAKVSAHHAIIPTETRADPETLTEPERQIYDLIARAYVAQFHAPQRLERTEVMVNMLDHRFICKAALVTQPGWTALTQEEEETETEESPLCLDLRSLTPGQEGTCVKAETTRRETKPPPLYTMASLLTDLTRVAKYVKDPDLRAELLKKDAGKEGEHGGIGTPATRDTILKTLFERSYLEERGKSLASTGLGRELYDALPDIAKFPDMTALWHRQQRAIQAGEQDTESFIRDLASFIAQEVTAVQTNGLPLKIPVLPCPRCQRPLRRFANGTKGPFWSCSGRAEGTCTYSCDDKDGKPVPRPDPAVSVLHKCMGCGQGLKRRDSFKTKGEFWWSCSGYPTCRYTYPDLKGKPDYSKKKKA